MNVHIFVRYHVYEWIHSLFKEGDVQGDAVCAFCIVLGVFEEWEVYFINVVINLLSLFPVGASSNWNLYSLTYIHTQHILDFQVATETFFTKLVAVAVMLVANLMCKAP